MNVEQDAKELQQLRESVARLTNQCAQLDEANRGWLQYHRTQSDNFRTKLHDYLPMDENTPLDQIAQQIVDQIAKEREDFNERFQAIEKENDDLRSGSSIVIPDGFISLITFFSLESTSNLESIKQSYMNTVNELNQKLLVMKEAYDQLDNEKQGLISELAKRPVEVEQEQPRQTFGMFFFLLYSTIRHCIWFQKKYHPIYSNNRLKRFVSSYLIHNLIFFSL